jgi:hypothetical protein
MGRSKKNKHGENIPESSISDWKIRSGTLYLAHSLWHEIQRQHTAAPNSFNVYSTHYGTPQIHKSGNDFDDFFLCRRIPLEMALGILSTEMMASKSRYWLALLFFKAEYR